MSTLHAQRSIEELISARRVDVSDCHEMATLCREHAVPEIKLRAMLDAFGPLSQTLTVYLTR